MVSAQFGLEVDNELLLQVKREGENVVDAMNKRLSVIKLNREGEQLQVFFEKTISKLHNRLLKAKGGIERKRIKKGKTRVMLQKGDN